MTDLPSSDLLITTGCAAVHPDRRGGQHVAMEEIDRALHDLDPSGLLFVPADWTEVVCGLAIGMDLAGKSWAEAKGKRVHPMPVTPELYAKHGRYIAPKMRNRAMAERAHAAIIFWDGTSGGSADMACRMVARDKPVRVIPWARGSTRTA